MTMITEQRGAGSLAVLGAVCLAALVLPLSFSAGAVATPAIGRDLGGDTIALAWHTNAFMLAFGSLLMAAGALADQFGRKRIFIFGVGLFVLASFVLGFAPDVWTIDILRGVQGIGAAGALSGGTASLAQEFHGRAQIRAFSMIGTTFGLGLAFGPILAGFLIENFGWRSIYLSATAIGTLALIFGTWRMHETRDLHPAGVDLGGTVTFTGALILLTFGIIQAPESGWNSTIVASSLGASFVLFALFVWWERRVKRPMLDLSLFRYARFVGVQVLPVATCYSYVVLLILLPLRFIGVEGMSEIRAGLLMIALSAPMLIMPTIAAWLTRWFSAGAISGMGLLIATAGLVWLGQTHASDFTLVFPMIVIGVGSGLPWGLMDGLSVSVVPRERAGMATGIFSTMRVAGEGVALAVVSAGLAGLIGLGLSSPEIAQHFTHANIHEIGHQVAAGNLLSANRSMSSEENAILMSVYYNSFEYLTYVLALVTFISAGVSFLVLGSRSIPIVESAADEV